jgi:RNA polymerase sigma-70 factor (ECF subfamily)
MEPPKSTAATGIAETSIPLQGVKALEEDRLLIARFVHANDQRAFVTLIRRHMGTIRRLLYTLFRGHRSDMEDAEQEVLLGLFQNLHRFRGSSSFRTYLFRFVRNKAIDLIRKKERERRIARRAASLPDPAPSDPEEQILQDESRREVLDLLMSIPEKERTLLLLKDVEGCSIKAIAKIMGVPEGTIKSRLHRTRGRLADMLTAGRE